MVSKPGFEGRSLKKRSKRKNTENEPGPSKKVRSGNENTSSSNIKQNSKSQSKSIHKPRDNVDSDIESDNEKTVESRQSSDGAEDIRKALQSKDEEIPHGSTHNTGFFIIISF